MKPSPLTKRSWLVSDFQTNSDEKLIFGPLLWSAEETSKAQRAAAEQEARVKAAEAAAVAKLEAAKELAEAKRAAEMAARQAFEARKAAEEASAKAKIKVTQVRINF